jgi:hypothetical protein
MRRRDVPTRAQYDASDEAVQRATLEEAMRSVAEEVVLGCRFSLHEYQSDVPPATRRPLCTRCRLRAGHLIHHPALRLVHASLDDEQAVRA